MLSVKLGRTRQSSWMNGPASHRTALMYDCPLWMEKREGPPPSAWICAEVMPSCDSAMLHSYCCSEVRVTVRGLPAESERIWLLASSCGAAPPRKVNAPLKPLGA